MTYEDLRYLEIAAWNAFLNVFEDAGLSRSKLKNAIDGKDSFNDVSDAVMEAARSILTGDDE